MSSHTNRHLPILPLKHMRWPYVYRLIQILAGSCAIALAGLALFNFTPFRDQKTISTSVPRRDAIPYTRERPYPQNQRLTPVEVLKDKNLKDKNQQAQATELQTGLYDLDGNLLGTFLGLLQDTTPDGLGVITYANLAGHSYISRLDGTETKALAGIFQGFTPDGQQVITYTREQSHLYDLNGTLSTSLDGLLGWGTLNGQYLVTSAGAEKGFNLYKSDGTLQANYAGNFRGFALHTPHIIATDQSHAYLYDFNGSLLSTFDGRFQAFSPNNESLIISPFHSTQRLEPPSAQVKQSHLYTFDGSLQAILSGEFAAFTPLEANIITETQQPPQTWLYEANGEAKATFEGSFLAFTSDGKGLITHHNGTSYLYSLEEPLPSNPSENERTRFEGRLSGITTNAQQLVTVLPQNDINPQSQLYNINGTKLANLEGLFVGFISNEQRIVTVQTDIKDFITLSPATYRIYDLKGSLKAVLTGQLLGLTQSGRQGLVIYADGKTRLYNSFDGSQQAVVDGRVVGFTRDETGVFIDVDN